MSDYAQECLSPAARNPSMGGLLFRTGRPKLLSLESLDAALRCAVRDAVGDENFARLEFQASEVIDRGPERGTTDKFGFAAFYDGRCFTADGETPQECFDEWCRDELPRVQREFGLIATGA